MKKTVRNVWLNYERGNQTLRLQIQIVVIRTNGTTFIQIQFCLAGDKNMLLAGYEFQKYAPNTKIVDMEW